MHHRLALRLILTLLTGFAVLMPLQPAGADGLPVKRQHHRQHHHTLSILPGERHVIEGVLPPGSGVFRINGRVFTAKTAACSRWQAGERIRLVSGDWHGACVSAVFRNAYRGGSCAMWCG